jgi:hypothetical protein
MRSFESGGVASLNPRLISLTPAGVGGSAGASPSRGKEMWRRYGSRLPQGPGVESRNPG